MTDQALLKTIKDFRKGLLENDTAELKCFMVCAPLQAYLGFIGYTTELVKGIVDISDDLEAGHYWLRLRDGRIVDPTADQFSTQARPMPEVYIGALPGWYQEGESEGLDPARMTRLKAVIDGEVARRKNRVVSVKSN